MLVSVETGEVSTNESGPDATSGLQDRFSAQTGPEESTQNHYPGGQASPESQVASN